MEQQANKHRTPHEFSIRVGLFLNCSLINNSQFSIDKTISSVQSFMVFSRCLTRLGLQLTNWNCLKFPRYIARFRGGRKEGRFDWVALLKIEMVGGRIFSSFVYLCLLSFYHTLVHQFYIAGGTLAQLRINRTQELVAGII